MAQKQIKKKMKFFWGVFNRRLVHEIQKQSEEDKKQKQLDPSFHLKEKAKLSNNHKYYNNVMELLHDKKKEYRKALRVGDTQYMNNVQNEIEHLTMDYKQDNKYQTCADLFTRIVSTKGISAKQFVKSQKYDLPIYERTYVDLCEELMLEGILLHVMGKSYDYTRPTPMVKLSLLLSSIVLTVRSHSLSLMEKKLHSRAKTLIEYIQKIREKDYQNESRWTWIPLPNPDDEEVVTGVGVSLSYFKSIPLSFLTSRMKNIREDIIKFSALIKEGKQKPIIKTKNNKENNISETKRLRKFYSIGVALVEFMLEKEMIFLPEETLPNTLTNDPIYKRCNYYISKSVYAICNIDLRVLPLKQNLPMIVKPEDWTPKVGCSHPERVSDLMGGYLSNTTRDFDNRFHLLTSKNNENFYLKLRDPGSLCNVLNTLQQQRFIIDSEALNFFIVRKDSLIKLNFLEREDLLKLSLKKLLNIVKKCYYIDCKPNTGIRQIKKYEDLVMDISRKVQKARYEKFILDLASAYEGYTFYLPAFLDFRGRIYRCGVLNFHERDLSKCLIRFESHDLEKVWVEKQLNKDAQKAYRNELATAAAFKCQKFPTKEKALNWYLKHLQFWAKDPDLLINRALRASDPFQFMTKVVLSDGTDEDERIRNLSQVPVTQDASASAFQIMGYLLLNYDISAKTNLILEETQDPPVIQDLYENIRIDFLLFLQKNQFNEYSIAEETLTRKVVKRIYMPMIYGKTLYAISSDLRGVFQNKIESKDIKELASLCFQFWEEKYPGIANLMNILNIVGWFCSVLDKPVSYTSRFFTTIQDYMKYESVGLILHEKTKDGKTKRRKASIKVQTQERDSKKTKVATCANFIHQKDAEIAMKMVLLSNQLSKDIYKYVPPIYSVHDNFITTSIYAERMPEIYIQIFDDMDHPLSIINQYLYDNIQLSDSNQLKLAYSLPLKKDCFYTYAELERVLFQIMPEKFTKKRDIDRWNKNIDILISSYMNYKSQLLGVEGVFHNENDLYLRNYIKYKDHLNAWMNHKNIYCLHY